MKIPVFRVKGLKEEDARTFHGNGYDVIAHKKSCLFCDHCTDIFYDYKYGAYMFFCVIEANEGKNTMDMLLGKCKQFAEEIIYA